MRYLVYILALLLLFFGPPPLQASDDSVPPLVAQAGTEEDMEGTGEDVFEEGAAPTEDEDVVDETPQKEETTVNEKVLEEDLPAEEETPPPEPAFEDEELEDFIPEGTEALGPRKIMIDAVVYVDYQFFGSSDAFKVKYHLNMGGTANLTTALIKGDAEIATEVTGYLAKWPQGQCLLDVSISKVPYEITYYQAASDEADIKVEFKKDITERWESTCTFIGGGFKPFITEGPIETWVGEALTKAAPPLTSVVAPLAANEATSITFTIPEYNIAQEDLGSAIIKGTGIVTVQPLKVGGTKAADE